MYEKMRVKYELTYIYIYKFNQKNIDNLKYMNLRKSKILAIIFHDYIKYIQEWLKIMRAMYNQMMLRK